MTVKGTAFIGVCAGLCLGAVPALAVSLALELPERAREVASDVSPNDTATIPVGPWTSDGSKSVVAEGNVTRRAWQIPNTVATTLQLTVPLREQLADQGFADLFECGDADCGGFDFRFSLDLLPEPAMHVDLGDFRYLVGSRDVDGETEWSSFIISRGTSTGYIHMTSVSPSEDDAVAVETAPVPDDPTGLEPVAEVPVTDLIAALTGTGHVALDDLAFQTGSSSLGESDFASLQSLASYLGQNPDMRVALVGHTDADGSLSNNIALSERRALAVLNRLVERHGVLPRQLTAEGVGYLSPRAANDTPEGRTLNRRVEAVLLPAP